jgi:hypothetical protein
VGKTCTLWILVLLSVSTHPSTTGILLGYKCAIRISELIPVSKYPNTGDNWFGQKCTDFIFRFNQYTYPHIWTHVIRLGHVHVVKSSDLIMSTHLNRGVKWLGHKCANIKLRFDQYQCPTAEYDWYPVWRQVCYCNVLDIYCRKLTDWRADYCKALVSQFSVHGLHFFSDTKMATVLPSGLRASVTAPNTELSFFKMLDFWKCVYNEMRI